jgi:hypothetical protein
MNWLWQNETARIKAASELGKTLLRILWNKLDTV